MSPITAATYYEFDYNYNYIYSVICHAQSDRVSHRSG